MVDFKAPPPEVRCIKDSFDNYTCTDGRRIVRDAFGNYTSSDGTRIIRDGNGNIVVIPGPKKK